MNHSFLPSGFDKEKCVICKGSKIMHTDEAGCECCDNIGPVNIVHGTIFMCSECEKKEKILQAENNTPEKQNERVIQARIQYERNVEVNGILKALDIDNSITVRTDLFNAPTIAINDLKKMIDEDTSIDNKPYALASLLKDRFTHYKNLIFEKTQEIVEAGNHQKAIQVYLNNLANQLRQEEREKLKIADINYKPQPIKPVMPKTIKVSKRGIDKAELAKYAKELGVSEITLQMLVTAKGITVETAANLLRRNINETKSMD